MHNPPLIGKNIQRLRSARKLTLNVLSERSGVSKAMLSQIESDKVNPTVATVWKISKGLNVELNDLLEGLDEPTRVFALNPAKDDGTKLEQRSGGVTIKILSPLTLVEELEMYLLTFEGGAMLASDPHFAGTQEFLTVVSGTVTVSVGEHTATLKAGDFLMYHCDIEHVITNTGSKDAVVHMVVRFSAANA